MRIANAAPPLALLQFVIATAHGTSDTSSLDTSSFGFGPCAFACAQLAILLPGRVDGPHSPGYELGDLNYWSVQQSSQRPTCRVNPESAQDVSRAVTTLRLNRCKFAVKSGGHASFAGASNIDADGVAIDLGRLNQVKVSCDRKTAAVGAGRVWSSVYKDLDKKKLSVVGGRSGDIGVGGLTLGGGISFFSGRYGWACDMVKNYEIVLADGSIRNVNQKSYPDLFWALRGGGNNFGIVTRFDLKAFEQGDMWGGQTVYSVDKVPALNEAFYNFNINHHKDPYGAVIFAYVYFPAMNGYIVSMDLEYGKPEANPAILKNFTGISSLQSSQRITNMTDLAVELNATQPAGLRETFWTFTVHNNVDIMADIQDTFASQMHNIADAPGLLPALVFQPISTAMTTHFESNGGNALGITAADGPLTLINISIAWKNKEDDKRILKFAADFIAKGIKIAKQKKLFHEYIYQNYAAKDQNVFAGYGAKNHDRLKRIQGKYDPTGVFSKLQPGYFKL